MIIRHRTIREEQLEHRSQTINLCGHPSRLQVVTYSSSHPVSHLLQSGIHLSCSFLQGLKGCKRGRNTDWIAAVGSSLVYGTHWREFFHDVPSAATRGERKPPTENLAK